MNIKKYVSAAVVAGAVAFGAGGASALTFSDISTSDSVAATNLAPGSLEINFNWDSAPVTSFVEFTIDMAFDLNLTGYEGGQSDVTGYTVDFISGIEPDIRLTNQGDFCRDAAAPVASNCNLVGLPGGTSSLGFESPPALLFEGLAAGSYRIGMFDSGSPQVGSLSFQVAAVPLPAGIVLLLSGLGLLGVMSHRKA